MGRCGLEANPPGSAVLGISRKKKARPRASSAAALCWCISRRTQADSTITELVTYHFAPCSLLIGPRAPGSQEAQKPPSCLLPPTMQLVIAPPWLVARPATDALLLLLLLLLLLRRRALRTTPQPQQTGFTMAAACRATLAARCVAAARVHTAIGVLGSSPWALCDDRAGVYYPRWARAPVLDSPHHYKDSACLRFAASLQRQRLVAWLP